MKTTQIDNNNHSWTFQKVQGRMDAYNSAQLRNMMFPIHLRSLTIAFPGR